jgi:hypothetical protein
MILNDMGRIALQCLLKIPQHFPDAILHEYIVMPNHIHGIIELVANDVTVGVQNFEPLPTDNPINNPTIKRMMRRTHHPRCQRLRAYCRLHLFQSHQLFLPHKNVNRRSRHRPMLPNLVFEKSFIRLLHPLRQIAEKDKTRNSRFGQLGNVFDFDYFALVHGRRRFFYNRE